jgi:23S rRNA (cytidine1920-2'-O)/16S rRNA (cytidine1409-2'-O)-methyltransferase
MSNKTRLDVALTERGLIESREKGKALIMAGKVYVNGQKALKAGTTVNDEDSIEIKGDKLPFVSRGGLKLDKAIKSFNIDLKDKVCMDVGASTGGFTDCMLQNGAKKVYSVDVGYGQLAWKLRTDERVVNMERTNFRYVKNEDIEDMLDFSSVDVSFISLEKILPVMYSLLKDNALSVCLIKPQFEAGRDKVGKKGVVRERETHIEVIEKTVSFAKETGFCVSGLDFSPIKGPEGNIEYLMLLKKSSDSSFDFDIENLVNKSHESLRGE